MRDAHIRKSKKLGSKTTYFMCFAVKILFIIHSYAVAWECL
ncbi:Uncharacterized protein dnm_075700 [Desulfonema magnum]|uniref:Uncharacterized protein n=1 Tax=Desulfonema magnum TaxID=45655 RepID=A0A975BU03_9BACT|nr:Uncharacterized protein dnm_075700 [Desulfonema magnum]